MLPLQLLRVKTRKGEIFPLFCTEDKDSQIAEELVKEFRESEMKKEQKKLLDKRVAAVEAQHDDYKLVRGFATLLERRCQFNSMITDDNIDSSSGSRGTADELHGSFDPASIRKELFEESSRVGLAVTDMERDSVLATVASKMNLSTSYIRQAMWSDLEENMVLERFDSIDGKSLVAWYNLSLMQTLLFNCTRLEFNVSGGANWKRVLRNVKRLGLMYNLQQREKKNEGGDSHEDNSNKKNSRHTSGENDQQYKQTELVCSIDGPISLFKLTDRYGTSIAKLLPPIVSSDKWFLDASIVRKTMSGKKIYEFKIDSSEVPSSLTNPYTSYTNADKSASQFDSSVEEKFANRFEQSASDSGWKLVREPDPIILSNGRAFIPDFVFEKYGKKVYLEIVGFWTREYIERKIQKLNDVVSNKSIDLFIALNEQLACSKIASSSSFSSSIPQERIIFYKNDSVPVKALLDYLKSIDKEQIERHASDSNLKIKFDGAKDIISIGEILSKLQNRIPMESAIAIASRDNENDYVKAGSCFISKSKVNKVASLLAGTTKFQDACVIFSENSIPEPCHAELIAKLGYDVLWESLDSTNAVIVKRK